MNHTPRIHEPVLFEEVLKWLAPSPGKVIVDGTLGAGGHTLALARKVAEQGTVIAFDRDPAAIDAAEINLAGNPIKLVQADFSDLTDTLRQLNIQAVDGILLDLGLSSDQLADEQRGFSFQLDGPLDMRFNPDLGEPGWRLINRLEEKHLANIIFQYGEERCSRRIAREVCKKRFRGKVWTTKEFAELVRRSVPPSRRERIDRATRTFQALRIAVNGELDSLQKALNTFPALLRNKGRMVIISFHSLEDRLVKHAFRDCANLKVLTPKPVIATEDEVAKNPRARSAKLRAAEFRIEELQ